MAKTPLPRNRVDFLTFQHFEASRREQESANDVKQFVHASAVEHQPHRSFGAPDNAARRRALVLCSGGADSVTLAYKSAAEGSLKRLLAISYGQRHQPVAHASGTTLEVLP